MEWSDLNTIAMDFETSGTKPEFALQPWRIETKDFWLTSLAVTPDYTGATGLYPDYSRIAAFLDEARRNKRYIVGWNTVFDISCCCAMGLTDLVMRCKWLDGMLLWKHAVVEPEYEMKRAEKQHFKLKGPGGVVALLWPDEDPSYGEGIDFHDDRPEARAALQAYNELDTAYTLKAAEHWWGRLTPRQQDTALIEAEALPLAGAANVRGIPVDTLSCRDLQRTLECTAAAKLAILAPLIEADATRLWPKIEKESAKKQQSITETVVRSPTKLREILFNVWGCAILKMTKPLERGEEPTGDEKASTDKEALHELALDGWDNVKHIHEYRQALNRKTKFADNVLESVDYNADGRTHPTGFVFSTYCVPCYVEVLTRIGWVRLDRWGGGDIVQVRPDLSMEFLPAEPFAGPLVNSWVHLKQQGLDCLFTDGHTIPYLAQKTGAWRTQKAGELGGEAKYIPVAGTITNLEPPRYSVEQMRLFVATQADGYSTDDHLKFTFVKKRKIERIKELLTVSGVRYREATYTPNGYSTRTEITIAKSYRPLWLGHDKKSFGPWILETSTRGLRAFVRELEFWDGSRHKDGGFKFSSNCVTNVEWATTAAALVGRKATIHKRGKDGVVECHISDENIRPARANLPRHRLRSLATHRAYCATTQTGFWLARSNGTIFVTGNTGRLTYASTQGRNKDERQIGFAIHQEKREKVYRDVIIPPVGYTLVEFDAAGQEYRWMAELSGDDNMRQMCMLGEDPHSFMGARIFGMDYKEFRAHVKADDKEFTGPIGKRMLGKVANLSCQYRTSAKRLLSTARTDYDIPMLTNQAEQIHSTYRGTYTQMPVFWRNQIDLAKRQGYVETISGRRVKIIGDWSGSSRWSMGSTAINYPIQGTGADQKYLALAVLKPYLRKRGIQFVLDMHDGLYFFVPDEWVAEARPTIKQMLDTLPYAEAWGHTPSLPLPWDCKFGPSWGRLAGWEP